MDKINEKEKRKENELYGELGVLEEALNDFWQLIPIPICRINPAFNILEVGASFVDFFGYSEEEIIGESLAKIFADKEDFEETGKELEEKKELRGKEKVFISKNGRKSIMDIYARPKINKKKEIIGYVFSFLDVTEKRKAENELKKKIFDLQKFAKELKGSRAALLNILDDIEEARDEAETEKDKTLAIIENFPEGLLFFNKENRLSSINPKAQRFFGISQAVVSGRTISELAKIEKLSLIIKIIERESKEKEVGDNGEKEKEKEKDEIKLRENLIVEVSLILVKKENRKIGTLVILRDITREKLVEKLKTEFVSITAHQLRTPLSAIKWTLRMILDGDIGKITDEQRNFLEKTYKSNERMIHLINDLLNVARIEEGRLLYNVAPIDIVGVIEGVISPLVDVAKRKNISLTIEKGNEKIPLVKADPEKISLVIQNLIENAIRYTNSGGNIVIFIKYLKDEKSVMFSVKDNGIGIPEEQKNRIFSRFFRGANAIRQETEGTGLGLYISKNIMEAHNGKIWFDSKEGEGTTFYITLPIGDKK